MSEPLTPKQEGESDTIGDLYDRLEKQRVFDWAAYGEALQAHIEAAAARSELTVSGVVHVDIDTFRPYSEHGGPGEFVILGGNWVEEGVRVTPLPGHGVEPLERLEPPAELTGVEAP